MGNLLDEAQWPFLSGEFNFGLITSGWGWSTQPTSAAEYSFRWEDDQIAAGQAHGITHFRLMHLVAPHDGELPTWLQKGRFSADQLMQILRKYVTDVMHHFEGRVEEYVVINEPFFPGNVFKDSLGQAYIDAAFETARQVNPNATLMLNCWGNHSRAAPYTTAFKRIADGLEGKGLLDKVGLQMHIWPHEVSQQTISSTILEYGIPAAITEFDVDMRGIVGNAVHRYSLQAGTYESVLGAAIDAGVMELSFWGCNNSRSWLESPEFDGSEDADPNMWDAESAPKPAYYATRRVPAQGARQVIWTVLPGCPTTH